MFVCVHVQNCVWVCERESFLSLVILEQTMAVRKQSVMLSSFSSVDLTLKFLKQLTCVCETEALIGSRGVAVELQPQAIGRTIDDMTHHAIPCKVAKETG